MVHTELERTKRSVSCMMAACVAFIVFLAGSVAEGTWTGTGTLPGGEESAAALKAAEEEAVRWLIRRMVPNETVPDPVPFRRRLLLSYLIPSTDPSYPYLFSRSFIYDDAVGAVALTMAGRYREAERVLSAVRRAIRDDGSFFFVYNTHNSWPNEEDREESLVRTGSVVWAGYAIVFYLLTRTGEDTPRTSKKTPSHPASSRLRSLSPGISWTVRSTVRTTHDSGS